MSPKFFDIHSHVNFVAYDTDREEVIQRAQQERVWMINVGTQKETSESAIALAEKYDEGMYATVGVHPTHAGGAIYHDKKELSKEEYEKKNFEWDHDLYKKLAAHPKVVAIGECGLDYFRLEKDTKEKQRDIFIKHIELANELKKPLMLHVRGERSDDTPYEEALEILNAHARVRANFHFFAGSLAVAKKIWGKGHTASFTGVITFTNDYHDVVKHAPEDAFMSETDCPYIAPAPHRGKRNEPAYVIETVKKISEIRGEDIETTQKCIQKTALQLFFSS